MHFTNEAKLQFGSVIAISTVIIVMAVSNVMWPNVQFAAGYIGNIVTGHKSAAIDPFVSGNSNLSELCPPESQVYVWGWADELYSYYNWQPASRYVTNVWQITVRTYSAFYRQSLISSLEINPPRCIVEAIGPQFFGGIPSNYTLSNDMPSSRSFLNSCYIRMNSNVGYVTSGLVLENGQAVTVYVRTTNCKAR